MPGDLDVNIFGIPVLQIWYRHENDLILPDTVLNWYRKYSAASVKQTGSGNIPISYDCPPDCSGVILSSVVTVVVTVSNCPPDS